MIRRFAQVGQNNIGKVKMIMAGVERAGNALSKLGRITSMIGMIHTSDPLLLYGLLNN